MEDGRVKEELLSPRQIGVAVMTAGLSWAGAQAGRADWRWALAAVPAGVLLGWLLLRRTGGRPLFRGPGGGVLAVLYGGWAVVLLSCVLRRTADRIVGTGGSEAKLGWILLLLTLPLVWIGCGKKAAFFRLAEILWLAAAAVLAALALLMLPKVEWGDLAAPSGSWEDAVLPAAELFSAGLFTLPYLYKVRERAGARRQGLGWLAGLGLAGAALTALTVGVLSPALASQLKAPFFAAVSVVGASARLEGLISALWLLPDLALMGLLAQVWGKKPWPAVAAALACALALTGLTRGVSPAITGGGSLILAALTLLIPSTGGKIVVPFS